MSQEMIDGVYFVCALVAALSLGLIATNLEKIAKELKRRNDRMP